MAFHQPTRPGLQRIPSPPSQHTSDFQVPSAPQARSTPDETQTWVLFSPADNAQSSYLSSSDRTLETAGRSRVSDFGSLDTHVRSGAELDSRPVSLDPHGSMDEIDTAEDDAELDSLDSHLPDFRAVHNPYADASGTSSHALPVLPAHDGMGSFRLDQPAPEQDMQDRIYAFERFNPARRISAQRDEPLETPDFGTDPDMAQRMRRIESWRLEQSQLLLEHIRKETRARRASHSSAGTRPAAPVVDVQERTAAEADEKVSRDLAAGHENVDWHDGSVDEMMAESGGLLSRLTRKFLQELIGIDDHLLSILFGESLPDQGEDLPRAPETADLPAPAEQPTWQLNMLERVARELGVLMNCVSHHPGAFSAYARMQRMPLPYAGLPVIPETDAVTAPRQQPVTEHDGLSAAIPDFQPTIPQQQQAPPPDMRSSTHAAAHETASGHKQGAATFTQEEWERDLDIKLVFRYLRSRFTSRSASSPSSGGTSHLATSSTQDIAAKAARVRAHHPLVARGARAGVERRSFKASAPPGASAAGLGLRHASSCASQSTRRSGRRSSVSSRHYWDIGGSLGTGSVIASNGPMGSWGEV